MVGVMSSEMRKASNIYNAFVVSRVGKRKSFEFKEGVSDALQSAAMSTDTFFSPTVNLYKSGTCQHDAWAAGCVEGRRLWRINGGDHG